MNITLNGAPATVAERTTVADLLEQERGDRRPHGIAVAVGDDVVCRDDWSSWPLRDGDTVEIVTAVQGG